MDGWNYKVSGTNFGPVTFDELVELAKNREFSSDDEVRFGENGVWRKAGSIGRLMAHLPFKAVEKVIRDPLNRRVVGSGACASVAENGHLRSSKKTDTDASRQTTTTASNDHYWCLIQGLEYGPVDRQKLIDWVATRRLNRGDQVRLGSADYVLAEELLGLFPRDHRASLTQTNAEMSIVTETQAMAIPASKKVESSVVASPPASFRRVDSITKPNLTESEPNRTTSPTVTVPSRPQGPVRRPSTKNASSGSVAGVLTGKPAIAAIGVLLVGALVWVAGPFISFGESADVKRFHELRSVYYELATLRNEDNVKPEAFAPLNGKLEAVATKVAGQVKDGKDPKQKKLLSLANKMRELSKEKLGMKPTDTEAIVGKTLSETAKRLGVKG